MPASQSLHVVCQCFYQQGVYRRIGWDYGRQRICQMDDRVIDHLPDFQLYDPWVTQNYLVKDIMNHKTGFQPQALDVVPALGYDRDDLFQMFRLVRPTYGFRSTYAYCNALYTVAARIIEKYTGLTMGASFGRVYFQAAGDESYHYGQRLILYSRKLCVRVQVA